MKSIFKKPKVFISHGKAENYLQKIKSFLETLNVEPIIVIEEPNLGSILSEKVKKHIRKADCILVIATPDNKDESSNTYQPRANVSHEIGFSEALKKPMIFLKHEKVDFGTNYSDKVWIPFNDGDLSGVFQKIIEELKKFNLISIVGMINKNNVQLEVIDKILRLIKILNIQDKNLKAQLFYLLGIALYSKASELTGIELEELFQVYPEYASTCAYESYRNENIYEALKLLSSSLEIKEDKKVLIDYILILLDVAYIGEGTLDNDIVKEVNELVVKSLRESFFFTDNRVLKKLIFILELLEENNRLLFWLKVANISGLSRLFTRNLKYFIFNTFLGRPIKSNYFEHPKYTAYFLDVIGLEEIKDSIDEYDIKNLQNKLIFVYRIQKTVLDSKPEEKYLIFKFLRNYYEYSDLKIYKEILEHCSEDIIKRTIWLIGEKCKKLPSDIENIFRKFFKSKNHSIVGILATTIGKMKNHSFNLELIEALKEFDFESRGRIIWAMGELGDKEFLNLITSFKIEKENIALQEKIEEAKNKILIANKGTI